MLYRSECLRVKEQYTKKLSVTEMRMFWWMSVNILKDQIKNENARDKLGVLPIYDKVRETFI